ncbi:hypothetical protein BGZ49_001928 [Haplosporangium sp. Z 27]|nr:hypothetical protein BGZ49_001928 [Haplosporangium sp. Z 27]
MEEPRVVDVSSWSNADQYLPQFPLQKCRVLLMALRPSSSSLDPAILASRHPQIPGIKGSSGERMQLDKSQAQLYASNPGLVSVSLCGVDGALAPALLDVCDAFRGTLNTLAGMSWFLEPSVSHLSWNWEMPCLTRLDLEGTIAVNFDLESLRYCPFLQVLRLNIARKIPSNWNVLEKAKQLTKVSSHLRHLNLGGWWGLPDSVLTQTLLPVLKRLHTLDIMWCSGPTRASILELMRLLPSLTWLGVSATESEQDEIQSLKSTLGLNMEIDIFLEVD